MTIQELELENEQLRQDKARLDWLLEALQESGQILNQLGWTDGRAAIDAAMKGKV
jgi:hypothetical protein